MCINKQRCIGTLFSRQGRNRRTARKSAHHGCPKDLPAVYRILWNIWEKVWREVTGKQWSGRKMKNSDTQLIPKNKGSTAVWTRRSTALWEITTSSTDRCGGSTENFPQSYAGLIPVQFFSSLIVRAFDDCVVSDSVFKLLNVFGTLLQRRLISLELSDKIPVLLNHLSREMDDAKTIFIKHKVRPPCFWVRTVFFLQKKAERRGKPQIDKNFPVVAGQLKFALEVLKCFYITLSFVVSINFLLVSKNPNDID